MARRGENIYRRRDGRYEGRYVIGRDSNGRTRFGYIYGRQYLAVRSALLKKKAELLSNCGSAGSAGVTVSAWMESWLENEHRSCVKPSTYQTYLSAFRRHILPHLGGFPLHLLTPAVIRNFLDALLAEDLSPQTAKGAFRLLSAALRRAQEEGMIRRNPCRSVRIPEHERDGQRILSREEQERIRRAASERGDLAVLLAMHTGMRLGEICALKWSDVDRAHGTVSVRRTAQRIACPEGAQTRTILAVDSPKSAHSRRTLPLPAFLLEMLEGAQDSAPSSYIFGTADRAADPRTIQRRFQRLLASAGVAQTHFHTLRHSFAARLLELGADVKTVSTLLGHSTTRTTLDFYVHSLPDSQRRAVESLARNTLP